MYSPLILAHELRDKFLNVEPLSRRIDRILRLAREHDARFTFFVTSANVTPANADLLTRIAEDGHELGSHSFDHINFATIDRPAAREQIRKSLTTLEPYGTISGFRAPYLRANAEAEAACADLGLVYSSSNPGTEGPRKRDDGLWTMPVTQPMDYEVVQHEGLVRSSDIIARWASFTGPGEILLFHPWRLGSRRYIAALERILTGGSRFGTMRERLEDPETCCVTFDLDFLETKQVYGHTFRHLFRSPHFRQNAAPSQ